MFAQKYSFGFLFCFASAILVKGLGSSIPQNPLLGFYDPFLIPFYVEKFDGLTAYLILDNGCIIVYKNFLYCHCWYLEDKED